MTALLRTKAFISTKRIALVQGAACEAPFLGFSLPRRGSVPGKEKPGLAAPARRGAGAGLQVVLLSWEGSSLPGNPDRRMRGVPGKYVHLFNSKCAKLTNRETEAAVDRLRYSALSECGFRFRVSLNPKGKHFIRLKAV